MASTSRRACRRPRHAYRMLRMAYRMLRYWIRRRSAISYVFGDVSQRHRNLTFDIVLYRCCTAHRMRHRQKTYDVVYDVARTTGKNRKKTYDIVRFLAISYVVRTMSSKKHTMSYTTSYTMPHVRLARTCILTYDIVRQTYYIVYDIVYDICMNTSYLGRIITHNCLDRPCSIPVTSRQQ